MRPRKGISVIEVLFAIGVAAVGLLGVITLLPVALHSMGRGTTADRASRIANNAISEVHARAMLETTRWRWRNRGISPSSVGPFSASTNWNDRFRAFAIDPRFVARNGMVDFNGATYVGSNLFPYVEPTSSSARMERITLSSAQGLNLSAALADSIFVSADDIAFDIPADKEQFPIPQVGSGVRDSTSGLVGTKRQYLGDMSWMATVVPKYDESGAFNDEYILSIVVFQRRDPTFAMDSVNERVATVSAFHSSGLNGGEISIQSSESAEALDLRPGDWVLLMARPFGTTSPSAVTGQRFRWYRVTETEIEPRHVSSGPDVWERDVKLDGPDWRSDLVTEIALIDNVVHVMDRTVRLNSTSLWMP